MLRSNTLKQAAIVSIGVGAGPLVQLVATPFLARLYMPSEFGNLAIFVSAVSVMATVSCLRYEAAIAVVEDANVKNIAWIALCSTLVFFLAALLLVGTGLPEAIYSPFSTLGMKIWGVPVVAAFAGVVLVGSYLTLRQGRYLRNAAIRSSQSVLFVAIALCGSAVGLVKANIFSAIIVGVVVLAYLLRVLLPAPINELRLLAVRFRQYPLLLTPTSLLDAFALALPVFFISLCYGLDATGNYTQIQRLIGAPMMLGGLVVGQLFLKRSGELFRAGVSSRLLMWNCVGALGLAALMLLVVLWLVGEPLCRFLLGGAWRVDAQFLLLVTTPFLLKTVISPVSTVFLTHNKIVTGVKWQVAYFVTTIIVLSIASANLSFENFLIVYGAHEALLYAIYLAMADKAASFVGAEKKP